MAGRKHEAVAVGPVRVGGVEFQEAGEQHRGDVGHAHGQARVARIGLLDRIHGEEADRIGHAIVVFTFAHRLSPAAGCAGLGPPIGSWPET